MRIGRWRMPGVAWGGLMVGVVGFATAWGCGNISPFAVLNFVNQNQNSFPRGGGGTPTIPGFGGGTIVNTTCDLSDARSVMTLQLRNESSQHVAYSLTFLVSAGSGGFVCEADRPFYQAFGYQSMVPDANGTFPIGCDVISLSTANGFRGGTELLGVTFSELIAPNLTGMPENAVGAGAPFDGVTGIPLPEVIVLGDNDSLFICQGNNICTQGGFTYTNAQAVQIVDVTAQRTQGTLCNAGAGTRPEWRLLNPSASDSSARAFEFVAGSSIAVSVLDRVFNVNLGQNQVVWAVIGPLPGLAQIHPEQR